MNNEIKAFSRPKALLNKLENNSKLGIRGTQGTLRLKVLLGNSGSYTWQIGQAQNQIIDEIRLRQGDSFIPTKIGMYIQKVASTLTDSDQVTAIDRTFPNPLIFTGAAEAALLEGLYHGRIVFNINSTNLVEFIDTLQFRRVGMAQQLVNYVVASPAGNGIQRDSWDGGDYGLIPFHQDILLNGQANQSVQLQLPTAINAAGTSSSNYAILIMRGIMILNGAKMTQDASINSFLTKNFAQ